MPSAWDQLYRLPGELDEAFNDRKWRTMRLWYVANQFELRGILRKPQQDGLEGKERWLAEGEALRRIHEMELKHVEELNVAHAV